MRICEILGRMKADRCTAVPVTPATDSGPSAGSEIESAVNAAMESAKPGGVNCSFGLFIVRI